MDHAIISGIVNSLPIEKMVSAPLMAAINAQTEMSMQLANFIKMVGIEDNNKVRMVSMEYEQVEAGEAGSEKTTKRYIQAPFLAMTGLPNLAIEDVNIAFELEVTTADETKTKSTAEAETKMEAKGGGIFMPKVSASFTAKVSHSSEQTRRTDTRAKYSFNVSARKQAPPEAFMRLIEVITDAATTARTTPPASIEDKK